MWLWKPKARKPTIINKQSQRCSFPINLYTRDRTFKHDKYSLKELCRDNIKTAHIQYYKSRQNALEETKDF